MHIGNLALLSAIALFSCGLSRADEVHLKLNESQAVINSINKFKGDGYSTGKYELIVRNNKSTIEVVFLPYQPDSGDPWSAVSTHLKEVHYYFDESGEKFLRKLLGK